MYKMYAVMFFDDKTKKVSVASFYSKSERAAMNDFRECYRHGDYRILAVAEIPE